MARYIDCFVVPVPKENLKTYLSMAKASTKAWIKAGEAIIGWTTEVIDGNKTRMTWSMDQDLPYFQRYFGLFMNGMLGETFDRGLGNLKKQIEKS